MNILEKEQDKLIENLEKLLICYRIGKKPSEKLLDDIHNGKEKIKEIKMSRTEK